MGAHGCREQEQTHNCQRTELGTLAGPVPHTFQAVQQLQQQQGDTENQYCRGNLTEDNARPNDQQQPTKLASPEVV
jgi:hypothetical protein